MIAEPTYEQVQALAIKLTQNLCKRVAAGDVVAVDGDDGRRRRRIAASSGQGRQSQRVSPSAEPQRVGAIAGLVDFRVAVRDQLRGGRRAAIDGAPRVLAEWACRLMMPKRSR